MKLSEEKKKQIREYHRRMAQDTLRIIENRRYSLNGREIHLPDSPDFTQTIPLTPERLEEIAREPFPKVNRRRSFIYLTDADSLAFAEGRPDELVMNFANAHTPGGGFLNGASAQEESLCRRSTLYAALTTPKASLYYSYNAAHSLPGYSDYMLLHPHVCVFREENGEYLNSPFSTAVMTVPAPNLKKDGASLKDSEFELKTLLKNRLRCFLAACAHYGYRILYLGAWGCGAFGNDPHMIARCFYELFVTENWRSRFISVFFNILGGGVNYDAFAEVFGTELDSFEEVEHNIDPEPVETPTKNSDAFMDFYTEARYPLPRCNHNPTNVTKANIGYTAGILDDGIPFEAEEWEVGSSLNVTVYLPSPNLNPPSPEPEPEAAAEEAPDSNVIPFENKDLVFPALALGSDMVFRRNDEDCDEQEFLSYLIIHGMFTFTTDRRNAGMECCTDPEGNNLICLHVTLQENGEQWATTSLHFRPFPNQPPRTDRVVFPEEWNKSPRR